MPTKTSAVFHGLYAKILAASGIELLAGQAIKVTDGAGAGKLLTSDAGGVCTLAAPAAAPRYSTALSWAGGGPYTMTVTAANHGRGTKPQVTLRETTAGVSTDFFATIDVTDATGDFTITAATNPTGYVLVL